MILESNQECIKSLLILRCQDLDFHQLLSIFSRVQLLEERSFSSCWWYFVQFIDIFFLNSNISQSCIFFFKFCYFLKYKTGQYMYNVISTNVFYKTKGGCHGRDRMVVGFTTTYATSAYHHWCCEFESWSEWGVQHHTINACT